MVIGWVKCVTRDFLIFLLFYYFILLLEGGGVGGWIDKESSGTKDKRKLIISTGCYTIYSL